MKTLQQLFPRASPAFLAANAPQQNDSGAIPSAVKAKRGVMNKTEAAFALILEAQKHRGDILRYEFEGITLRFNGVRYTADFAVFHRAYIKLIEVKGAFCKGKFERAVERFRHAKTYYGDVFLFELHQKTRQGWRQIL